MIDDRSIENRFLDACVNGDKLYIKQYCNNVGLVILDESIKLICELSKDNIVLDMIEFMINLARSKTRLILNMSSALLGACRRGDMYLINYIITRIKSIEQELKLDEQRLMSSNLSWTEYIGEKANGIQSKLIANTKGMYITGFRGACETGNLDIAKYMFAEGNIKSLNQIYVGINSAYKHYHLHIINYIESLKNMEGMFNYSQLMEEVYYGEHLELIELLIQKNGGKEPYVNYDIVLWVACKQGNEHKVKLIMKKCKEYNRDIHWPNMLYSSLKGGNINLIEKFYRKCIKHNKCISPTIMLINACESEKFDIFEWVICKTKKEINNVDWKHVIRLTWKETNPQILAACGFICGNDFVNSVAFELYRHKCQFDYKKIYELASYLRLLPDKDIQMKYLNLSKGVY